MHAVQIASYDAENKSVCVLKCCFKCSTWICNESWLSWNNSPSRWAIPKNWNQDSKIKKYIETNKSTMRNFVIGSCSRRKVQRDLIMAHITQRPFMTPIMIIYSQSTQNWETTEPECLSLDSWTPKGDCWKKSTEAAARELWSASSPVWSSSEAERVLTEKGGSNMIGRWINWAGNWPYGGCDVNRIRDASRNWYPGRESVAPCASELRQVTRSDSMRTMAIVTCLYSTDY